MTFTIPMAGNYDLDRLDAYLSSPDQPDEVMLLSQLDGYLTAIAIAPKTIMPSEWLPLIWGGEGPGFTDAAVANAIYGSIMGLYNDNLRTLADDTALLEPIFDPDTDGSPLVELWAEGFIIGLALRPDDWRPLIEDEETSMLLTPIVGLVPGPDGEYAVDLTKKERERLLKQAPTLIPACVMAIREHWREKGLGPAGDPPLRIGASHKSQWLARGGPIPPDWPAEPVKSAKVGRNAPCPCGSGRKYKRCCGA